MSDIGLLRIKSYEQSHLPEDQQDDDLNEKAENDVAAYVCIEIYFYLK